MSAATPAGVPPPDLDRCRRFLAHRPPPGALLLCALTGSHLYGFSSPDSDLDLKGIHQAPNEALLGLDAQAENHDALEVFEGVECDLTTHELRLALSLLLRGNGNLLERLESPFQLVEGPVVAQLRALGRGARSQASFGHYRGYLQAMMREHGREQPAQAKSLLYCFRVALTGRHLMETGEVVAHLPTLAVHFGYDDVLELVSLKAAGAEQCPCPADLGAHLLAQLPGLVAALEQAKAHSPLPRVAPNRAEVEAFLLERRKADWR